ncbi:hypothetical protein BAUCODRAFT_71197 [Baudoinia panamericana UAMH 10762]|uniref:AB hydrolase-1 domain-containing protein n=1 Tax=Baudoinia panamericana (strain UAMH 10762) TaxID=717646 RepID=M2MGQ7_BAUPA|nr:uncharacterized protein BAUCODRAFT_71197 [Baudoinia panamericana UAMH 10762]EMC95826.1 hypothetical protein BAUCODRAFT_71197 [Baudoinia panamericana UAMH 10762]
MAGLLIALILIATGAKSAPTSKRSTHIYGNCQQLDIPITASAPSAIYDLPVVDDNLSATAWAVQQDTWSTPDGSAAIKVNTTTMGTWNIHAQLCYPTVANNKVDVLQIATHGAYYDSRYWDPELDPENQSYVEAALKAGYSILTYDRLGAGQSDHPDAYTIVQAPLELEILRQLTVMARNGTLSAFCQHRVPDKVVHVGHSFGSVMTSAFIGTYPELSDGAVITGYVLNKYFGSIGWTSWDVQFANESDIPFSRPSGYVVDSKSGIQNVFFGGNLTTAFTRQQFDYGNSIKQPVPIGELASSYQLVYVTGPRFEGPIQYFLPEFDFFICGGDCKGVSNLTLLHGIYPNASTIEVAIQPNTGHGLTLHNNATAGYEVSFDFLNRHGLGTGA